MNRTLLLILCDFLLLNLLALTRWEKAEPAKDQQTPVPELGASAQTADQDLVAAMKQSLANEQATREQLAQRLSTTESTLATREQNLAALQTERTQLSASLAETQRAAAELNQRVAAAAQEATMTKEQMAQLQRELEARRAEAERQQQALSSLEKQQATARQQIEGLNVAVRVAEQEKILLQANVETFRQQAAAERQERERVQATTTQLAAGVGQLAEKSSQLTQEIRDNRPINANVLFGDFLANRVQARMSGSRPGIGGNRQSQGETILVTDGLQTFALLHVADTPFTLYEPFSDWTRLSVEFSKGTTARSAARTVHFLSLDPRIVAVPVTAEQVKALGVKVYQTALDPVKFPDAVLISGAASGYGELTFQLNAATPGYVQVENRLFRRLSGQFTPGRGDLVLSRTGELLGIMVNDDYCVVVSNFLPAKTITTGEDIKSQATGTVFSELTARLRALPLRLQ